ncbi:hypothetical protein [Bacteroides sp. 519]|uniref:hypothetical protein n=1 Tax=Bacteroides sp. 519 TaxID=2302937 RepID=UPI0013D14D76|nr:hypothetical protein [Bacteroides sp. 519]NDV59677.1 hypothetical protein [Bacteroides sp. 519]
MRVAKIIVLLLLVSNFCYSQTDTLFSYNEFKHCFQKTNPEQLIPKNHFTQFLYSLPEHCFYYAIEMVECSNECVFFVVRQVIDDGEEPIDNKLYLVFKNGELVDDYNPYSSNRILEIHIEGEGGILSQNYKIENDSSIIITYNESECCLSTGYDTVIEHSNTIRYSITKEGKLQIKDILNATFSSPFFDIGYLNSNNPVSPQKDEPYELIVKNMIQKIPIYQKDINIYFYIKNSTPKKTPLFFSSNKQNVIDEYIPDKCSTSSSQFTDVFFNQPIQINVSPINIVMDTDGFFTPKKEIEDE